MGRDEMGSYYRDPNLTWQLDERYNPGIALANPDKQHADNQPDGEQSQPTGSTRYCSVRGCTSALPPNCTNKMCDVCRGRHRIYASTKRAKRKMEKAAIGLQNGWVPPPEDDSPANADPASASSNEISAPEVRAAFYPIFLSKAPSEHVPGPFGFYVSLSRGILGKHGSGPSTIPIEYDLRTCRRADSAHTIPITLSRP